MWKLTPEAQGVVLRLFELRFRFWGLGFRVLMLFELRESVLRVLHLLPSGAGVDCRCPQWVDSVKVDALP